MDRLHLDREALDRLDIAVKHVENTLNKVNSSDLLSPL